jgi:hypothetical protein
MAAISQFKVAWTGVGVIGAANSTFYAGTTGGGIPATSNGLQTFFTAIKALIPASVTIQVPSVGQTYDDVTGQLLSTWGGPAQAPIVCTGAGAFGSASGASVQWTTNVILRRHLLIGRTFLVPLVASAFNANGVLSPASVSTISTAAQAFAGIGAPRIWSRPSLLHPAGGSGVIIGWNVRNVDAILRSRRQ